MTPLLFCVVLVPWFFLYHVVEGFVPTTTAPHHHSYSTLCAKQHKKKNTANNKKKKTVGKNKKKKTSENNNNMAMMSKPQKHAPPWKVLSTKDAKKNLQKEKERRELVQQSGDTNIQLLDEDEATNTLDSSFLTASEQLLLKWSRCKFGVGQLKFVGATLNRQLPPQLGVPEVAFLGRSNVGKSSLLNSLASSQEARVGKTPGATASVNLYCLESNNNKPLLGLVDLPGFGYAKLSKETKESVQVAAERYLQKRNELALGILLVDIRRAVPTQDDKAVLAALYDMGLPIMVVATKTDKVTGKELDANLESIRETLGLPDGQPFCVSATTGQGVKQLWSIIMEACETRVEEIREEMMQVNKHKKNDVEQEQDEDDDDLAYDQGYDWIHGSYDEDSDWNDDRNEEDYEDYYYDEEEEEEDFSQESLSLKSLKKKARDMERRNEV